MVARSVGYDVLGDIRDGLRKALGEGRTFQQFADELVPLLKEKGWWGLKQRDDGEIVQLGSTRRLRTIFDVNLRVSYAAGAWERAQRTKRALPYIVYMGIDDDRQRPEHKSWMGTCLPVDHPWWDTHWCPCGWRCRCWNRQVTRLEAERIGVTEIPPSGPPKYFFNPSTGRTVEVPYGVDPGFGYNVGKAAMERQTGAIAARQMADNLVTTPPLVAALPQPPAVLADLTKEFARWIDGMEFAKGDLRVVGALPAPVLSYLRTTVRTPPASGAITITDHQVKHILRADKGELRPSIATLKRLPELLARPAAILWDRTKGNLVWVVELAGDRGTRFVVELDHRVRTRDDAGRRVQISTNAIVNGQLLNVRALRDRTRYELISGNV